MRATGFYTIHSCWLLRHLDVLAVTYRLLQCASLLRLKTCQLSQTSSTFATRLLSTMPPKRKAPASVGYSDSTGASANSRSAKAAKIEDHGRKASPTESKDIGDEEIPEPTGAASPSKQPRKDKQVQRRDQNGVPKFDHSREEERNGIVQRQFYPPEMSNERCAQYNNNDIPRPIEALEQTIKDTAKEREKVRPGKAVIHWYKRDLRVKDNVGLSMAGKKAKEAGIPLVCIFIVSPQDYEAHFTGPPRVDFDLRTLKILKDDLAALDIPLLVETVEKRKEVPGYLLEKAEEWGAKHVYCNIEYEVDELRREARLTKQCLVKGINFTAVHDDVVVPPGQLQTGAGKQYAVYSPWYRAWVAHIHAHPELLDEAPAPSANPPEARERFSELFASPIPKAPASKRLCPEKQKRLEHLWPAGEHEAIERLERFLSEKINKYKDTRNFPAAQSTASVSVHHSAGTLAARTSVRMARDRNNTRKLDGGNAGAVGWISEVAWRDFYKHVLAHWPYVW